MRRARHIVWLLMLCTAALACLPGTASAAVDCSGSTVGPINFGAVDPITSTTQTIPATLTINCTSNDGSLLGLAGVSSNGVKLHFNAGTGPDGVSGNNRQIDDGKGHFLPVQVYQDSSSTTIWGGAGSHWLNDAYSPAPFTFTNSTTQTDGFSAKLFGPLNSAHAGNYSQIFSVNINGSYSRCTVALLGLCVTRADTPISGTFTFQIKAQIEKVCHASFDQGTSIPTLNFGAANFLNGAITAETSFTMTCTNGTAYQVGLDNGEHFSSGSRHMANGTHEISYQLYQDAAHSLPWGATGSPRTLSANGTGQSQSVTIYGQVPTQAGEPAGTYTDTVQVQVTY